VGLAARAGTAAIGVAAAREALRSGRAALVLVAGDASRNTWDKLIPSTERRGIAWVEAFDRDRLGRAVGRAAISAVAIEDPGLGRRLLELLGVGKPRD
jgi:ribosomal protein L7Ae-like RNA K-turn-binding protein